MVAQEQDLEYLQEPDDRYYTLDVEGDSLTPTVLWCIVIKHTASGKRFYFYGVGMYQEFKDWLLGHPEAILIGHNILSYDVPEMNRLIGCDISYDRLIDTLVLSYLYDPKMVGGHSLEAWGERLGYLKDNYNDFSEFSVQLLNRCIQDVDINEQVFLRLRKRMAKKGYSQQSCWIEHNIRRVIDEQQTNGFYFDKDRAIKLRTQFDQERGRLQADIIRLFPPVLTLCKILKFRRLHGGHPPVVYLNNAEKYPKVVLREEDNEFDCYDYEEFNIASPKQRIQKLLSLGWKPINKTKTGAPQADESSILEFAEKAGENREQVKAIAEWLVLTGRSNMIGTWLNNLGDDSRIHGRVFSCGAGTRRMTHSAPNSANIPGNDAKYGRDVRQLWTVDGADRVLVGYDAKALEMRVFGHYLNNPEAARLYIEGDPHTLNTIELGYDPDKNLPWRKLVKACWYAMIYGAQDKKLGSILGKSSAYGKLIRNTFMKTAPGLKELVDEVVKESSSGFILCIDGGFVRAPHAGAALNYKIQSAGTILMKLTAILLDKEIKRNQWDAKLVGSIHDEGQLDCHVDCADNVGRTAVDCIRLAGRQLGFTVEQDGDYKIGKDWSKTH